MRRSLWEDGFREKFYHNVISFADSEVQPYYAAIITSVIHCGLDGLVIAESPGVDTTLVSAAGTFVR